VLAPRGADRAEEQGREMLLPFFCWRRGDSLEAVTDLGFRCRGLNIFFYF
jgi:hypothetical protein